jgi:hypothetical protein
VSSLITIRQSSVASCVDRGATSVDRMMMPSLDFEVDSVPLACIGRRRLNEATQKLHKHPSVSIVLGVYTDPIGWGMSHRGRRKGRVGEFRRLTGALEARMPRVPLAREAGRMPKPWGLQGGFAVTYTASRDGT